MAARETEALSIAVVCALAVLRGDDPGMQTLAFQNGDAMPALGLGTWQAAPGVVGEVVERAVRLGYRHIDCAAVYGNQPEIGRALQACLRDGVVTRGDLWITSKLWNDRHAPDDVRPALEETLAELQLDHLDLYLVHWPVALRRGAPLPPEAAHILGPKPESLAATWSAIELVRDAGLCRHIGVSNCSQHKLRELADRARVPPEANQVELHPYLQQEALVEYCRENGVVVTAYAPLGSRDRPDRLREVGEAVLLDDPVLDAIASRHDVTPATVLLAWALARGTAAIPKSVDPDRLRANLAATGFELPADDLREIRALDRHRRYISGETWTMPGSPITLRDLWDEDPCADR